MIAFGRRADDAAEALLRPLQRVLSCVTTAVLVRTYAAPGLAQIVTTGRGSVRLAARSQPLGLSVLVSYDVVPTGITGNEAWQARISGYAFELRLADDRMLIAFHWHPSGRSTVAWPHLHVGIVLSSVDLGKSHIPSGEITLQQVIGFAIRDCGARPLRADWADVID